jgi:hypothetical protein
MRTTVDLEALLLRRARQQAARRGTTLSVVVCEALSAYLNQPGRHEDEPFELITCGEPGRYAPSPAEIAAALEEDDRVDVGLRRRRSGGRARA